MGYAPGLTGKLIKRLSKHILHSFASLLLSNGESLVYVKEQLGHSSTQMTVDIYGHLIPSSNRQAVNALDEDAPKRTPSTPAKNKKAATR